MVGLAFDPNTNTLYGVDLGDRLVTIDIATAVSTDVGGLGFANISALAFDPNSNTLYATDIGTDRLLTINTTTGVATEVGSLGSGFEVVSGLAFDPNSNVLYGIDSNDSQLLRIDTSNGNGTLLGSVRADINSLGFHHPSSTLYGTNPSGDLFSIVPTPSSQSTTNLGSTGFSGINGLTAVPEASAFLHLALLVSGYCWGKRRVACLAVRSSEHTL